MTTVPNLNPIPVVTGDDLLISHDITTNRSGRIAASVLKEYINTGLASDEISYSFGTVEEQLDKSTRIIPNITALATTGGFIGDKVYLLGHTVAGVGGGIFIAKSSAGLTNNNGTVVVNGALAWVRDKVGFVTPEMFGATTLAIDSTLFIQAAIDYAESLVSPPVDGIGDHVGGVDVILNGEYKVTEPLRLAANNINIRGVSGTTIYPYFTSSIGYNGAKPVFIIGSAELWQNTGIIGDSYKYNTVSGIHIKAVSGYNLFIGFLFSGTRNATLRECFVERGFCGLLLENSSEFYSDQFSSIGCVYGVIHDNRANRIPSHSVLNVACTDNDVSSNKMDMTTIYYSQHTAVVAINTGTTDFNGMTVGVFSDNPSVSSPGLGLPATYAGVHIFGANAKWTRAMLLDSVVFEANQSENHNCILIESSTQNSPCQGVTLNNIHVQTYASDPVGNILTTLLKVVQSGNGDVHNILLSNSGFTYQSDGYYTGRMCDIVGNAGVRFENCYPTSSFVLSNIGYYGSISPVNILEHVNLDTFPPTGWAGVGTTTGCSKVGGSSGVVPYLEFAGDLGSMYIEKTFDYLLHVPQIKSVFITFLAYGDGDLHCVARVNNASDTDSSIINPTNQSRYGQAIVPNVVDNVGWRRLVFCFNPFSANYDFNTVRFQIGRKSNAVSSKYIRIQDIRVGYFIGEPVPYNPFS